MEGNKTPPFSQETAVKPEESAKNDKSSNKMDKPSKKKKEPATGPDGEKPVVKYCKVCDSPSAAGHYFGVLSCIPCKAFFIRCLAELENGIPMSCVSQSHPDRCEITVETRTVCKSCRYQKCIREGMARKERPACVSNQEGRQLCAVCADIANGVHFGAVTCEGCKKFFRRGLNEAGSYSCRYESKCVLNPRTRNSCRFCRWQKCLAVGMSRNAIRMGRPSKFGPLAGTKKKKKLEQQLLEGGATENDGKLSTDKISEDEKKPGTSQDSAICVDEEADKTDRQDGKIEEKSLKPEESTQNIKQEPYFPENKVKINIVPLKPKKVFDMRHHIDLHKQNSSSPESVFNFNNSGDEIKKDLFTDNERRRSDDYDYQKIGKPHYSESLSRSISSDDCSREQEYALDLAGYSRSSSEGSSTKEPRMILAKMLVADDEEEEEENCSDINKDDAADENQEYNKTSDLMIKQEPHSAIDLIADIGTRKDDSCKVDSNEKKDKKECTEDIDRSLMQFVQLVNAFGHNQPKKEDADDDWSRVGTQAMPPEFDLLTPSQSNYTRALPGSSDRAFSTQTSHSSLFDDLNNDEKTFKSVPVSDLVSNLGSSHIPNHQHGLTATNERSPLERHKRSSLFEDDDEIVHARKAENVNEKKGYLPDMGMGLDLVRPSTVDDSAIRNQMDWTSRGAHFSHPHTLTGPTNECEKYRRINSTSSVTTKPPAQGPRRYSATSTPVPHPNMSLPLTAMDSMASALSSADNIPTHLPAAQRGAVSDLITKDRISESIQSSPGINSNNGGGGSGSGNGGPRGHPYGKQLQVQVPMTQASSGANVKGHMSLTSPPVDMENMMEKIKASFSPGSHSMKVPFRGPAHSSCGGGVAGGGSAYPPQDHRSGRGQKRDGGGGGGVGGGENAGAAYQEPPWENVTPAQFTSENFPPWEPPAIDYDYWLQPKLPNPDIFLSDSHNETIQTILSAYKDYIEDMEGTLHYLQAETQRFFKKYGTLVPPLEILRKELALFAQSTVSFCCRVPGFSTLSQDDQIILFRVGGNQARILTSSFQWYDKNAREYTIFYPLKPHPGRMDYHFYLQGKEFCQHIRESMEIDLIEEALFNVVVYFSTDYNGLTNPEQISKVRWQILECFTAYTTAKYGSSNNLIQRLFSVIPMLRRVGLLEHQLSINLSLLKDESYPIPDPCTVKQDFPLPDLVNDAITAPR